MKNIDLLYKREALKIEILADRPVIMAFIKNSYQLWLAAQWGTQNKNDVFYGTGWLHDVLGRQLARKSCMAEWRKAKETGNSVDLIPHVTTVLNYTRDIANNLMEFMNADTPYDAMVEHQTSGYVNPLGGDDLKILHKIVKSKQMDNANSDFPNVPIEIQNKIIARMVDMANLDLNKVEILNDIAHPACLGYGGAYQGVKLGITHDPNMTPFKSILTNWHEIGHAVYRQSIPHGQLVAGRAMDEAMAFLFEYWLGYGDDFMQMCLDEGFAKCGYDMAMLKSSATEIVRNTKRIETNPVRHIIDIDLCEQLERALLNEDIEGEDCEVFWSKLIEPYADILPDDYPYYYDVHMMSGIYGDRACYTPGLLAAMQIGKAKAVTMDNFRGTVKNIATSGQNNFDEAITQASGRQLSQMNYMQWIERNFK